jgi:hypothetical protein
VTLAQASLNAASDIDRNVIDEFRKSSFLLDRLPFDQSVNPAGGGSTLTYGYTRQITQRSAAFRAINAEYTPAEVTKQPYTTDLRPLGGSFEIDRVLEGIGAISEVSFQLSQLIKAAKAYFADQVINGDTGVTADGFDGLSKALIASSTEYNAGRVENWTAINTQILALQTVQKINAWLGLMDGPPDALLMNGTAFSWFTLIAALSGQLDKTTDAFGRPIQRFRDIPLIDLGAKAGSSSDVIATYAGTNEVQTVTITGTPTGGTFTLTFAGQTTAAIAYNAAASAVVSALEALSNIDTGEVTATGGALPGTAVLVTFVGQYAGVNVAQMTATGSFTGGTTPAVAVTTSTPGGGGSGTGQTGLTDLFAVRFGLDGFHGVAVTGPLVKQWLPDFSTAGAVKKGEVEMGPVSVALKASKAAAVFRNLKVA